MTSKSCAAFIAAAAAVAFGAALALAEEPSAPADQRAPEPAEKNAVDTTPEAATATGPGSARMQEVVIEAERPLSAASSAEINAERFKLRPHTRMIQLLNNVPGLVVAQHQGGNKAPQYLIRGFDADHGTDFAVFADDMPINMVSHAHGQGYADINFVIPETVDRYELFKGPYFVRFGDFANAGTLNLVTKDEFDENFALLEGGSFNTQRYVFGYSPRVAALKGAKTLLAGQAFFTDGPFDHGENLSKYAALAKLTLEPTAASHMSLAASVYAADWDGSGQIPLREVKGGRLHRFGSIDPTEGGRTDRENLDFHCRYAPSTADEWSFQAYASRYKLQLWSDFTFFKDTGLRFIRAADGEIIDTRGAPADPDADYVPGDGIEQNDSRYLYGGRGRYTRHWAIYEVPLETQIGVETRNDAAEVALHRQVKRKRFFSVNNVSIEEHSFSGFVSQQFFFTDWLRLEGGVRGDVFVFDVHNRLPASALDPASDPNFTGVLIDGSTTDGIVSPKANLVITPVTNTDVYLNFGEGYHSNDARNAILGENTDFKPLTRSIGYEAGVRSRLFDRLNVATAIWRIDLDSELVFSGDGGNQETGAGGTFEPAGKTRRWGVDLETDYAMTKWLTADYDLAWADAKFRNGDAVPLAPDLLMNGGLTAKFENGLSLALRARYLDDRPAIEDRSLTADGYFLLDLIGEYRWHDVEASLQLLNLTDTDWREAQFADTSCVRSEVGSTAGCAAAPGKQGSHGEPPREIHFTPGNPFTVIAGVKVYF